MNDTIRQAFESVCVPNFGITGSQNLNRNSKGEYTDSTLEDHWQTFQEGWECAINQLKAMTDKYSDVISTGGMDPR